MAKLKIDPENITGPQKAAIFLLTMGEEYSIDLFKHMSELEVKKVAAIMSKLEQVKPEIVSIVMKEYLGNFDTDDKVVVGGESFVKNVILNSMGTEKAKTIFSEIEEIKREMPFVWTRDVHPATMASYLRDEHPQTIAMILTHLPPEMAAEILMSIPDDRKGDIAIRIAQLGQVPEEIVRDVDEALKIELSELGSRSGGKTGGVEVLVNVINGIDKGSEDIIMESIEEEQSDMANSIREMMFVFEDLVKVDDKGMREILKKVESSQLTMAMKTASEEMKEKIFGNLSARAAEMLKEDLEVMGPVRLVEVEEAQGEVIRAAKELEAEGTIVLGGKGKGDVLV